MSDLIQAGVSPGAHMGMPMPEIPAHLLVNFCCVAEHKSVAHAATVQCLPYTVVAQQIARLERLMGLPVLESIPGKLRLTNLGHELWSITQPKAQEIQKQSQSVLKRSIQDGHMQTDPSTPTLQVELDLWGMAAALKPYLNILRDLPCNLNFVTHNARFARMPDVICHLGSAPVDGYDSTMLFGEEIVAVASAKYPTPDGGFDDLTLTQEPMLRLGHPDHEQDWSAYLGRDPMSDLPGIEKEAYSSFSHYLRALKAGRGVGVGLLALLQPELNAGTLKLATSKKLWRDRSCYLGVRNDCKHQDVAEDFANIVRAIFEPVVVH